MYTIYKHTAPNGKVYIGITKKKPEYRWESGSGYKKNEHFYRAILKYGWKNIKHEIVKDGLTKEQACNLEIELIAKYDATDKRKGYNISTGGECGTLGVHPSAETRQKMSEARKGKHLSAEHRRKIGEANKGKHHPSLETRKKMSEAGKGKIPWNKGKKGAQHLTPETRRKISEALKGTNHPNYGKHQSAETRLKISEAQKGKIPWNKKAVICVETGMLYSSVTEAAESIGVTRSNIGDAVRGLQKTSGGYHWKYAENMEESK